MLAAWYARYKDRLWLAMIRSPFVDRMELVEMNIGTLKAIKSRRIAAIIRASDREQAEAAANAVILGGFGVVEFTLNTPGALELITIFSERAGLIVGAGTVLSVEQVDQAVDAGATFIVSPHVDSAVIAATIERGAVSIPGAFTPSEMLAARQAGAHIVKLFPAPADIAGYVRQIRGPFSDMPVFPTAGVTPDNFLNILQAGAVGVGFVSSLFRPDEMEQRNFKAIKTRAEQIIKKSANA